MAPATDRLFPAVTTSTVTHDGDPRLAAHIAHCRATATLLGDLISKDKRGNPRKMMRGSPRSSRTTVPLARHEIQQENDGLIQMTQSLPQLLQLLDEKINMFSALDAHYSGTQPLAYLSPEAREALGTRFGRMASNLPRLAVTSLAERLRVTGFGRR